jgi:hypothetical protein
MIARPMLICGRGFRSPRFLGDHISVNYPNGYSRWLGNLQRRSRCLGWLQQFRDTGVLRSYGTRSELYGLADISQTGRHAYPHCYNNWALRRTRSIAEDEAFGSPLRRVDLIASVRSGWSRFNWLKTS